MVTECLCLTKVDKTTLDSWFFISLCSSHVSVKFPFVFIFFFLYALSYSTIYFKGLKKKKPVFIYPAHLFMVKDLQDSSLHT